MYIDVFAKEESSEFRVIIGKKIMHTDTMNTAVTEFFRTEEMPTPDYFINFPYNCHKKYAIPGIIRKLTFPRGLFEHKQSRSTSTFFFNGTPVSEEYIRNILKTLDPDVSCMFRKSYTFDVRGTGLPLEKACSCSDLEEIVVGDHHILLFDAGYRGVYVSVDGMTKWLTACPEDPFRWLNYKKITGQVKTIVVWENP